MLVLGACAVIAISAAVLPFAFLALVLKTIYEGWKEL
jgi:hypothetical protein